MSNESVDDFQIVEKNGKKFKVWPPKIPADLDDPNADTEIDLGYEEEIVEVPYPQPTTEEQKTINELRIELFRRDKFINSLEKADEENGVQIWYAEEKIKKLKKKIADYERKKQDICSYIKDLQKRIEELLTYE